MGLVEDQYRCIRQHLSEGGFTEYTIRQQQGVIHNDKIGGEDLLAQLGQEAVLEVGALAARAALCAGVEAVPEFTLPFPVATQLLTVAGQGLLGPAGEGQPEPVVSQIEFGRGMSLQLFPGGLAEVVGPALGQDGVHLTTQDAAGSGQIVFQELSLQLLGPRGNKHRGSARGDGRDQVAQGFACARARLNGLQDRIRSVLGRCPGTFPGVQLLATRTDRIEHQFGHTPLTRPFLGPWEAGEEPALGWCEEQIHGVRHLSSMTYRAEKGRTIKGIGAEVQSGHHDNKDAELDHESTGIESETSKAPDGVDGLAFAH